MDGRLILSYDSDMDLFEALPIEDPYEVQRFFTILFIWTHEDFSNSVE